MRSPASGSVYIDPWGRRWISDESGRHLRRLNETETVEVLVRRIADTADALYDSLRDTIDRIARTAGQVAAAIEQVARQFQPPRIGEPQ